VIVWLFEIEGVTGKGFQIEKGWCGVNFFDLQKPVAMQQRQNKSTQ